jgi:Fic family protein
MEFFLTGVKETSGQAIVSARRLIALLDADRKKIERLGRPAASVLRVFQYAQTHPILAIASTAERTGSTFPTVASAIDRLQRLGILHEITGRQRHRMFAYRSYMDILNEGTEPLRS